LPRADQKKIEKKFYFQQLGDNFFDVQCEKRETRFLPLFMLSHQKPDSPAKKLTRLSLCERIEGGITGPGLWRGGGRESGLMIMVTSS
jgi:hypothetical protein